MMAIVRSGFEPSGTSTASSRRISPSTRLAAGGGPGRLRVQPAFGEADVERHVAPILEAQLLEPGLEPFDGRVARRPRRVDDADPRRAASLLRLGQGWGGAEEHCQGEP